MRFCCLCVPLRDGITILGFFSLIICVVQWILCTALNPDPDTISFGLLKNKTDEIFSLLKELAINRTDNVTANVIEEQFKGLENNSGIMFNFVSGKNFITLLFWLLSANECFPKKRHLMCPGAPVGMWTWGRVHTKFWQPP